MTEELEQLRKKLRENSLGISRLPKETKLRFMELATKYCDDYGITLAVILEGYLEFQKWKEKLLSESVDLKISIKEK